jgi:sugar transferase (PEP-CTERM/EpsH1 system associated)
MNLIYFAPHHIWPLNSGGRMRNYRLARQLAARESVTLVEMCNAHERYEAPPDDSCFFGIVTVNQERAYTPFKIMRGLAGPIPLTVLNCWSPQAAAQLADVLCSNPFDTVQIEGVHLMEYLPIIQDAPGSPAIIVDWHNIESEMMWRYAKTTRNWAKKIAALRTATLIERAEDRLLASSVTHTVTSERERQKLLARCPSANIRVIPNGVDANYFSAKEMAQACRRSGPIAPKPTILFVGSMDYHANIDAVNWFSRNVWPAIAQGHPDLQFTIVGRNPPREVRALESDRIHVTGTVDDVRPYYDSAIAAIVPLRSGSGTRLKILEAMAAGVPVISTRLGAEGIEIEDNVHFLLADTGREIAAAVQRVVSSPETRTRLSQAARELVRKTYDWSVIGRKLCAVHEELVESRSISSLCKVS